MTRVRRATQLKPKHYYLIREHWVPPDREIARCWNLYFGHGPSKDGDLSPIAAFAKRSDALAFKRMKEGK